MDIFTTALGLSKQENGFELAKYLIERLTQEFHPDEMDVFEVFGISGDYSDDEIPTSDNIAVRRFNYSHTTQRKKSNLNEFHDAIANRFPLVVNDQETGMERIVIPVCSQVGPLRLVVISGISESPEERMVLFQAVELFTNLIALHDSHERDQLTGLMNRRTFEDFYQRFMFAENKPEERMFIAICDIDHFKQINDTFGHQAGDKVLLDFSHIMEDCFRFNDALFRFGGEEFIVLFKCAANHAENVLDRFRECIARYGKEKGNNLTVSAGFVECRKQEATSNVIGKADIALYYAKGHGRNKVINYDDIRLEKAQAI